MKSSVILLCLILFSCATSTSVAMTRAEYNDILLGSSIYDVGREVGDPYSVTELGDGREEYRYIERFSSDNELYYETHYVLTVVNGIVVDKRFCVESRPAFDRMYRENPYQPQYP